MLKQTFKTHTELKITYDEYTGLRKALTALEGGMLKTKHWYTPLVGRGKYFDMRYIKQTEPGRGRVSFCIAGLARELHPESYTLIDTANNAELLKLFYPWYGEMEYQDYKKAYTPAKGAQVLRHYLETGAVTWY
jgi:hypothetical protein